MVMARKIKPLAVAFQWKVLMTKRGRMVSKETISIVWMKPPYTAALRRGELKRTVVVGKLEVSQDLFAFLSLDLYGSKDECSSGSGVYWFGSSSVVAVKLLVEVPRLAKRGSTAVGSLLEAATSNFILLSHSAATLFSTIATRSTESMAITPSIIPKTA